MGSFLEAVLRVRIAENNRRSVAAPGRVAEPRAVLLDQEFGADLRAGRTAGQPHCQLEIGEQIEKHFPHASLASGGKPPAVWSAQEHCTRPQRECLEHVGPAADRKSTRL